MKTTDLMIGDWVKNTDINRTLQITLHCFELIATKKDVTDDEGNLYVTPIPLTEDILKANGLHEKVKYEDSIFNGEDAGYYYVDMPDEDRAFFLDVNLPKAKAYICFDYVHELQHALRLCGLSELADNFVIPREND